MYLAFRFLVVMLCSVLGMHSVKAEVVKDNSFLIEEAYNQEAGVVQFIQGYQYLNPSHE